MHTIFFNQESETQYFSILFIFIKVRVRINRHGIRQLRSGWADGPAYITQCPILTGQSYVYNFTIVGQRGTLWWHAHISWLRSTLYGPIVILPKRGIPYPFPHPYKEVPIMFGMQFWVFLISILMYCLAKIVVIFNEIQQNLIFPHRMCLRI